MFCKFPASLDNLSYIRFLIDWYLSNEKSDNFTQERTISKGFWLPCYPDLSPCDYFLSRCLKARVYNSNPRTLHTLKNNIREEIYYIPQIVLKTVFINMLCHAQLCLDREGEHFEHRL